MILGFIGFGEAGFELSKGLKGAGLKDIVVFDPMHRDAVYGKLIQERIQDSGVTGKSSAKDVLDVADVVIVAVPGDKALAAAQQLVPFLKAETLYVDVSASSPDTKLQIWKAIQLTGLAFVDAAMLGPVPVHKHKVPILASGTGADRFMKVMQPYGMQIEKVSEIAGEATAIKLVQSIFMKGLQALLIELLEAGSALNVADLVLKSLQGVMNSGPFEPTVNRLVTGSAIHAQRRAHEMKNVIELLESANIKPTMSTAIYERLSWLASKNLRQRFGGKPPDTWQEVISACEQVDK